MTTTEPPTQWDTVSVNGKEYCSLSYLLETFPDQFRLDGCKSQPRRFMEKRGVPQTDYMYARLVPKTGEWILSNSDYKLSKPLILLSWVRDHFLQGTTTVASSVGRPGTGGREIHFGVILGVSVI